MAGPCRYPGARFYLPARRAAGGRFAKPFAEVFKVASLSAPFLERRGRRCSCAWPCSRSCSHASVHLGLQLRAQTVNNLTFSWMSAIDLKPAQFSLLRHGEPACRPGVLPRLQSVNTRSAVVMDLIARRPAIHAAKSCVVRPQSPITKARSAPRLLHSNISPFRVNASRKFVPCDLY